jgi:hypothetical protein
MRDAAMNRTALKDIVTELGDACHVLSLALPVMDDPELIGRSLQHLLDYTHQRLDEIYFRETAGNHFRADTSGGQGYCIKCWSRYAPAGRLLCADCAPVASYVPRAYTTADRAVQASEIESITQGRHQMIPSKEKP